jgi:WhiB family transcriptional regulator, redox-sensing transcriptional regulator
MDSTVLWDESWVKEAACSGMDPNIFYPPQYGDYKELVAYAKSICDKCPVREQCLDYALSHHTNSLGSHGIWGGKTVRERRAINRERKRDARRSGKERW